jgi:hypothetical protein
MKFLSIYIYKNSNILYSICITGFQLLAINVIFYSLLLCNLNNIRSSNSKTLKFDFLKVPFGFFLLLSEM